MEIVTLLLFATFFAPLPEPWQRVCMFGLGLLAYGAYHFYKVYTVRQMLVCRSFILTARTCLFLVLLSSWVWSDVTVPKLVESDALLTSIERVLPKNVTFVFNMTSSSLTVHGENNDVIQEPVAIPLDRALLETFRLEMPQTPVVDWIPSLRTMGGFYEIWYKIIFGPWIQAVKSSTETTRTLIEITEYRMGDRVVSGGKRLGQPRKSGRVTMVYPSPLLDRFMYEVEWDSADPSAPQERSKEKASELVPESSSIYVYPATSGPLNETQKIPRDALALFTHTNMTLLEGFSYYYNQYWKLHRTRPQELNELLTGGKNRGRFIPYDGKEAVCSVPQSTLHWTDIALVNLERWRPLYALGVLVCSKLEHGIWECSNTIAEQKIGQLRAFLSPFVRSQAEVKEDINVQEPQPLWRYYIWWTLFFTTQTTILLALSGLFVCLTLAPVSYAIVNSLRNVEESGSAFSVVVHVSLRVYDSLSISYHVALALKHFGVAKSLVEWYLRNIRIVTMLHVVANTAMLFAMRWKSESIYDAERKQQLRTRTRQMRIVGRKAKEEDSDQPFCRICFENEGELVSPCLCGGSMRYVHTDCLTEWRFRSVHGESFIRCDQCHYRYKVKVTWAGFIIRSSLFISILSFVQMAIIFVAVAYFFKVIELCFVGRSMNDWALGPKVSHYIRNGAWNSQAMLQNPTEQAFVEQATRLLGWMHLELGHLVCAFILLGYIAFIFNEHFTMPWIWIVSDDLPYDEGWPLYLGGKTAIVVCVGLYRLFCRIWNRTKSKRMQWFKTKETTLVNVEPAYDDVKPGTILKTPYGLVRVVRYRSDDDVVETEFQRWQGTARRISSKLQREVYKLYRNGADCLRFDRVMQSTSRAGTGDDEDATYKTDH